MILERVWLCRACGFVADADKARRHLEAEHPDGVPHMLDLSDRRNMPDDPERP